MDTPEISGLNTEALGDEDVVNLILQRSEIIRDQPRFNRYIKAWTNGKDGPLLELVDQMGRDVLIRRAAAFIYLEFEELRPIFDKFTPKRTADIGCGYALFDLFLAQAYDCEIALIDLESNEDRHFGFKEAGSAYSSLANAQKLLTSNGIPNKKIQSFNPETDDLTKLKNLDYAFSFISCGYHYPWQTYRNFFHNALTVDGRIILDVRAHKLGDAVLGLSELGFVRAIEKAANDSADRILIVKSD